MDEADQSDLLNFTRQKEETGKSTSPVITRPRTRLTYSAMSTSKDLRYGCFGSHPDCLQPLNNIVGVVAFIGLASFLQNVANILLGVLLSTIEQRFDLTSSESSWIASADEIARIPILLLLVYLGTRVHRPRSLAIGLFFDCVGCLLMLIPQFTSPAYNPTQVTSIDNMCNANKSSVCDGRETESLSYYLPVFIVSRLLIGMGSTPVITVGVNYMNDCSTKEKFATYIGFVNAMNLLGSAIGVFVGAATLTIFSDFYLFSKEEIGIDSSDSRWIGAWWLSYTVVAGLFLLNALPMLGYPNDLPGAAEIRAAKVTEAHKDEIGGAADEKSSPGNSAGKLDEFRGRMKGLFSNPSYVMMNVLAACDHFIIAGFGAFGPKYLQFSFSLTPSIAGILFGAVLLTGGAGGTIIGGVIIRKLKLSCRQIIRTVAVICGIVTAGMTLFFCYCDTINFAGVTVPYNSSSSGSSTLNLTFACNADCACEEVLYEPVCSHENIQYYSPCHAGCTDKYDGASSLEYLNCSCITTPGNGDPPAVYGHCTTAICIEAIIFLVDYFVLAALLFTCKTMIMAGTLRVVHSSQETTAVVIQMLFIEIFGKIPGPLVFGVIFDSVCLVWKTDCDNQGSCTYYDNRQLAYRVLYTVAAIKCVSFVAMIIAVLRYQPPKLVEHRTTGATAVPEVVSDNKENKEVPSQAEDTDTITREADSSSVNDGDYSSRAKKIVLNNDDVQISRL